jgi:hypothetical protein
MIVLVVGWQVKLYHLRTAHIITGVLVEVKGFFEKTTKLFSAPDFLNCTPNFQPTQL